MKIRNGFVSNSSSSSFCIYGIKIKGREKEGRAEEIGLEAHYGDSNLGDNYLYIGRSWCNIGDNETGAQFKKDIEKKIKDAFGIDKCSTIEEAWQNG